MEGGSFGWGLRAKEEMRRMAVEDRGEGVVVLVKRKPDTVPELVRVRGVGNSSGGGGELRLA